MKNLIILLTCLTLMVSPVMASTYQITAEPFGATWHNFDATPTGTTYDASVEGKAIQRISWDLSSGTTISYTLYYGSGTVVSGTASYTNVGLMKQHTEVSMGGTSSGYDYTGIQEVGRFDIIGYAKNETSSGVFVKGLLIYDSVFGISDQKCFVFHPTDTSSDGVIYKVTWSSNRPVNGAGVYVNTRSAVSKASSTTITDAVNEWISYVLQFVDSAKAFISELYYWLNFFFIENIGMIVALFLAVPMAFAAKNSKGNPERFLRQYFKTLRGFFDFVLSIWRMLIESIGTVRGWFRI